ncbi:hypothetical protein Tco_0222878 [Tanacetum coccineum]
MSNKTSTPIFPVHLYKESTIGFIACSREIPVLIRSFGLLTNELRDALSIEPPPHIFKKKSLIAMGVLMELQNGICVWPAPRAVKEEEEAEEEAEGDAGHKGVGGSADIYRNMSQGDLQVHQARWMDQQDEQ